MNLSSEEALHCSGAGRRRPLARYDHPLPLPRRPVAAEPRPLRGALPLTAQKEFTLGRSVSSGGGDRRADEEQLAMIEELAPMPAGPPERAPLPRGLRAFGARPVDRAAQPPLLPRDARSRGAAGSPLRPPSSALFFDIDDFGDQRGARSSGRGRGPRGTRTPAAVGRPRRRHPVPGRRRRVRRRLPRVVDRRG